MMSDLEGAASILAMLEEKAGSGSVTPSEIAGYRQESVSVLGV